MPVRKIARCEIDNIIALYQSGKTCLFISKLYNVNDETIRRYLHKNSIVVRNQSDARKYTLDNNFFDKIDTSEKAYILGLLYADGYNRII